MIRLAFLGVLLLAGALSLGAFFLARGGGSDASVGAPEPSAPVAIQAAPITDDAKPDPLYFLREIDLTQGAITVILKDAITGQGDMFVRDQTAIEAAKDTAYINASPSAGEVAGLVVMTMMGASPKETVAQIYRDDTLVSAVVCNSTTCGRFAPDVDLDLGPLLAAAQPLISAQSYADNYDDYLADLDAITQSPDYMFLDLSPNNATPQERQIAGMELYLPTLESPAGTPINPTTFSDAARALVTPLLTDGAAVTGVSFEGTGTAVIADMDSGTPILAGGQPIGFPQVEFTNLRITIDGIAMLSDSALDTLSQPLLSTDYEDAFAAVVRDRLQSSCTDCYRLKVNGEHYTAATITQSNPEGYRLDYYDLRDAP